MENAAAEKTERNTAFRRGAQKIAGAGRKMRDKLKGRNLGEGTMKAAAVVAVSAVLAAGCWTGAGTGKNAPDEGNKDTGGEVENPGLGILGDTCEENYIEPNAQVDGATMAVMDPKGDALYEETVWADGETAGTYMEEGVPVDDHYWTLSFEFEDVNKEGNGIWESTSTEGPGGRTDRHELEVGFDNAVWMVVKLDYGENVVEMGKPVAHGTIGVGEQMQAPTGPRIELMDVSGEVNANGEHNITIQLKDENDEPVLIPIVLSPGDLIPMVLGGEGYWLKVNSASGLEEPKARLVLLRGDDFLSLRDGEELHGTEMRVRLDWDTSGEVPSLRGIELYTC